MNHTLPFNYIICQLSNKVISHWGRNYYLEISSVGMCDTGSKWHHTEYKACLHATAPNTSGCILPLNDKLWIMSIVCESRAQVVNLWLRIVCTARESCVEVEESCEQAWDSCAGVRNCVYGMWIVWKGGESVVNRVYSLWIVCEGCESVCESYEQFVNCVYLLQIVWKGYESCELVKNRVNSLWIARTRFESSEMVMNQLRILWKGYESCVQVVNRRLGLWICSWIIRTVFELGELDVNQVKRSWITCESCEQVMSHANMIWIVCTVCEVCVRAVNLFVNHMNSVWIA